MILELQETFERAMMDVLTRRIYRNGGLARSATATTSSTRYQLNNERTY